MRTALAEQARHAIFVRYSAASGRCVSAASWAPLKVATNARSGFWPWASPVIRSRRTSYHYPLQHLRPRHIPMKVLALCGSLRTQSRSLALLEATSLLAADRMEFRIFKGLGSLPLFNPDIEPLAPPSVQALWDAVDWSDALVIASPEYAHGVTGTLKNALDWLVGRIAFVGRPVAVFNPSHRAEHADASLKEILRTMNAQLIAEACLRIPATGCEWGSTEMAASPEFAQPLHAALSAIRRFPVGATPPG